MNSLNGDEGPGRWIITTCRDRLAHLRESLTSWLFRMPQWHPIIVCCDDQEAFEYASEVLAAAKRGAVLATIQGETFRKLDAFRVAVRFLESAPTLTGQSYPAGTLFRAAPECPRGRVAMLDADTIALTMTESALEAVSDGAFAIAGGGIVDDIGLLVADLDALAFGLEQIDRNTFVGYGHEDIALRVCAWVATGGKIEKIRAGNWSRKIHHDRLRRAHNTTVNLRQSAAENALVLVELTQKLIPDPDKRMICQYACYPWCRSPEA